MPHVPRVHNEPQREKTYFLICAANEDSNQLAHPRSKVRVFVVRIKKILSLDIQNAPCEASDQTARMRSLI